MAAQWDGRPASWLRAVHLCPARVLAFSSPFRPGVRASPRRLAGLRSPLATELAVGGSDLATLGNSKKRKFSPARKRSALCQKRASRPSIISRFSLGAGKLPLLLQEESQHFA